MGLRGAFLFVCAILSLSSSAVAQGRVALVIGNSSYKYAGLLTNSRNDAAHMGAALKTRGFRIIEGFDLDKTAFDRKVLEFAAALKGSAAGVFFFAGHGLQVAGQNYLVPIDAKADAAETLEFEMVRLDVVQRIMERLTNTNVLFLDACRDNPLARNLARSMGTRSIEVGGGLAAAESGVGTLISFSTQPGNVALDGRGANSPFAEALVRHIESSSDDLSAILIAVRNDVIKATNGKQVPWEHSALTGRFYFEPAPQGNAMAAPNPPAPHISDAERTWSIIQGTESIAALEDFIVHYHDSLFAKLAQERIDELKKQKVVVAPSPKPAPAPSPPDTLVQRLSARNVSCCIEYYRRAFAKYGGGGDNSFSWCRANSREGKKNLEMRDWCQIFP